jgi:hypothetical protein
MGETADLSSKKPQELHADIDRTRAEMSETIEEIKDRLSPEHIKGRVKTRVQEATIGRVKHAGYVASDRVGAASDRIKDWGSRAIDTVKCNVKSNPNRFILIGTGIGAGIAATLFLRKRRKDQMAEEEGEDMCACMEADASSEAFVTPHEHQSAPPVH